MISLLKYSKENRYQEVKNRKKNSKKAIYNSIVIKKEYLEAQESNFQAQYFLKKQ